ncbi:MarR family winged helix-turn-helix transcriptional regulator [Georgenia yuyongxinii]|uniref:MarR family transcriptional regulator n=1 Tax=Georgenia yuyongxinii TaxID=2589797 RepID=A0A552WV69_9MICO|nr:MarR family transcriptional regulator [Georgenia yuyongxinii]TRW46692.1 MarR family transcriptional regulator [Georgenia yuyongxinii]
MPLPAPEVPDGDLAVLDRALLQLRRFVTVVTPQVHDGDQVIESSTLLIVEVLTAAGGPLSVRELADELAVAHSTASRLVNRAAAAGAVTRTTSHQDARRRAVDLTRPGRELAARARRHRQAHLAAILADWTPTEAADLARTLGRFADQTRRPELRPPRQERAAPADRPAG